MSRAENRHHRERIKKNRKHYHGIKNPDAKRIGKTATTPHPCSCRGCANNPEPDMRERRAAIAERDEE